MAAVGTTTRRLMPFGALVEELPTVPIGYGVLVAPISDKPCGMRCALVRALPRRMEPSISIHTSGGNYVQHPASVQYDHIRLADTPDMATAVSLLAANGYMPTQSRPDGWPTGSDWFRHADGTWASIEMLDDGPDNRRQESREPAVNNETAADRRRDDMRDNSSCSSRWREQQRGLGYSAFKNE